jgi:hypothetical protein
VKMAPFVYEEEWIPASGKHSMLVQNGVPCSPRPTPSTKQ